MKQIRYGKIKKFDDKRRILTIGNFDGVHLGHQTIIKYCVEKAKKFSLKSSVLTFFPHPKEFFNVKPNQECVQTMRDKSREILSKGIDEIIFARFDKRLACTTSHDFIVNVLATNLGVKELVVGSDFRFGKDRSGDLRLLRSLCDQNKIILEVLEDLKSNDIKISSTLIRKLLDNGKFHEASKLLGRTYQISGKVIRGKSLGKRIASPTANIDILNKKFCFTGVFLGKTKIGQSEYFCIINFGPKPTFDDLEQSLEAHILDYDGNIYDEALSIEFLCKIRDQIKFKSIEELKNQINEDKIRAKELKKLYE